MRTSRSPADHRADVLEAAGRILDASTVHGARYAPATLTEIDTETFAAEEQIQN